MIRNIMYIENKYGDKSKVSVMLAAYDANSKLLATDVKTLEISTPFSYLTV